MEEKVFRKSFSTPTILDVAHAAGVSPATVSRVLNSTHPVSAQTREKVLKAVKTLRYYPNALARSLLKRHTAILGVLIPDVSNPYYSVILRGIEDEARLHGYSVLVCNTDRDPSRLVQYLRTLQERRADGAIVTGGQMDKASIGLLRETGMPVVTIGRHHASLPSVQVDNIAAAFKATQYLISLGHRLIATITGPAGSPTSADRLEGYRRALSEAGIPLRPEYIVEGGFLAEGGYKGTKHLFTLPSPPTAILAGNDRMAFGAIRALHEMGLRVPEDVSIVGFDDTLVAQYMVPALTTVAIPMYELGRRAAFILFTRLQRKRAPMVVVLPTELRIRESTGPPATVRKRIRKRSSGMQEITLKEGPYVQPARTS
ncbi:MAG: LacI family DNA-binding transcriptional regulator [Armatimonadota bacterium]|nr:LacI family DNA-binding transcriptional regulator [Armatimonadota bacterium]